jgi:hypothetical protein
MTDNPAMRAAGAAAELPRRDSREGWHRDRIRRRDFHDEGGECQHASTFAVTGTGSTGGCEAAYRARLTPARLTSSRRR